MKPLNYLIIISLLGLIAVGQENEESDNSIDSLTEETCSKKRRGCCSDVFMGDSPSAVKCMAIHSTKMPDESDEDIGKLMKFMSCLVECIYKKSKFIGKGDKLNMKMVKMEAEQLYAERPKEKEYFIKSYESCYKQTRMQFDMLKNTPGMQALLKNACRPYFMLLHMCIMDYHHKNECPYFRWESNDHYQDSCKKAKAKCYAIDGLDVPEDIFE